MQVQTQKGTTASKPERYVIEACDDNHEWDSDYVGNTPLTRAEAFAGLKEMETRAKTDPEDPELEGHDGLNWRGWYFRIMTRNEHGDYMEERTVGHRRDVDEGTLSVWAEGTAYRTDEMKSAYLDYCCLEEEAGREPSDEEDWCINVLKIPPDTERGVL